MRRFKRPKNREDGSILKVLIPTLRSILFESFRVVGKSLRRPKLLAKLFRFEMFPRRCGSVFQKIFDKTILLEATRLGCKVAKPTNFRTLYTSGHCVPLFSMMATRMLRTYVRACVRACARAHICTYRRTHARTYVPSTSARPSVHPSVCTQSVCPSVRSYVPTHIHTDVRTHVRR